MSPIFTEGISSYRGLIAPNRSTLIIESRRSPIFKSRAEAEAGKEGVAIITNAGYWQVTGTSTKRVGNNKYIAFQVNDSSFRGFTGIGYIGVSDGWNYPGITMKPIELSKDGTNWITVATSFGKRGNFLNAPKGPLYIDNSMYGSAYKYIRFKAVVDDSRYSDGGMYAVTLFYNVATQITEYPLVTLTNSTHYYTIT